MEMGNFFQMNDWEIRKFFSVVLAIQLTLWVLICIEGVGFKVPILRQLFGFIYLTIIPGFLILRALRIHYTRSVETLLYAVGLSLSSLMFLGLFVNSAYTFFGIPKPISQEPLIITITLFVLILCVLSYLRDRSFAEPSNIHLKEALYPPALFLCLLPFMAVLGTYLVNFHQNNVLLMILIAVLASMPVFIAFDKFIPKSLYPFAVFTVSVSLLYHNSLISMYLWGWDIHLEYYFSNLVIKNAYWNSALSSNINAMLAIVMLAPIYSTILDMEITWIFKIIYPLLFSLVPLGLYRVFEKQTDEKVAFLSCLFFMSIFTFYREMLALARQQIAELFLVLLILLMIDENLDAKKRFLLAIFGASLVVSHYGVSYLYMLLLILSWLITILTSTHAMQKISKLKFGARTEESTFNHEKRRAIDSAFILLFIMFTLAWYIYNAGSVTFKTIVSVGNHILTNIYELLSPEASETLRILLSVPTSILHQAAKVLHHVTQFFIVLGVFDLLFTRKYTNGFNREYSAFSVSYFTLYFVVIAFPYTGFGTTRVYHLSLIFLAPFCIIGAVLASRIISRILMKYWTDQRLRNTFRFLSLFLALFLLFNSGWIYEIAKDHPGSISLSQEWIKRYGSVEEKINFYGALPGEQSIFGAKWLSLHKSDETKIYADLSSRNHLLTSYGMTPRKDMIVLSSSSKIMHSYVYLRDLNVAESIIETGYHEYINISELLPALEEGAKIYSNGECEIYFMGEIIG